MQNLLMSVVLLLLSVPSFAQSVDTTCVRRCYLSGNAYNGATILEEFANKKSPRFTNPFTQEPLLKELSTKITDFQVKHEDYSSIFHQAPPSVVVLKDESFLIVWQDERNGDWDVYAQKFDSSGTAVGINFRLLSEIYLSDQLRPDVATLGDSSFVLVWVEEEEQNIYAQKFNPDHSLNGTPIQVNEAQIPNPYLKPALATFPDGGFVVTWQDTRIGINILARGFDSSSDPLGPSFKVNDGNAILPESPCVAADTSGVFAIVWNDSKDGDKDIYFQRYDSDGSSLGGNTLANTDVGSEIQYHPRITFGKNKDFMITWVDLRNGNEDIFARLFSWDAVAKTPDRKVNTDLGSFAQWFPDVGADGDGYFIVAWADYRGELPAMYTQKFDHDGTRLGPNIRVSDSLSTGENQMTSIWVNKLGDYVVCWWNVRDLIFDIYAQMVNPLGVLKGYNIRVNDDLRRGDADGNGKVDISDVVYLVNYLFKRGPAPDPVELGDVNCDNTVTISDVVRVTKYILADGPRPC